MPPAVAMQKSQPLPLLPIEAGATDDAASSIGLSELVGINLDLTKLYRDLAIRHDSLVDAVTKKLQEQAQ